MGDEAIEGINTANAKNGLIQTETKLVKSKHSNDPKKKKVKRTKERRIGYIIHKVSEWRKLYNGCKDAKGNIHRKTLDESAA